MATKALLKSELGHQRPLQPLEGGGAQVPEGVLPVVEEEHELPLEDRVVVAVLAIEVGVGPGAAPVVEVEEGQAMRGSTTVMGLQSSASSATAASKRVTLQTDALWRRMWHRRHLAVTGS